MMAMASVFPADHGGVGRRVLRLVSTCRHGADHARRRDHAGIALAVAIATAPSSASTRDSSFKVLLFSGFFTALWLLSATFFRAAAKRDHKAAAAH
jgi:hypothetical protein